MKVFAYLATTVNGQVAGRDDDTDWVSEEQWGFYQETVEAAGCAIVGRRTYELLQADPVKASCWYVVLTKDTSFKPNDSEVAVASSPAGALDLAYQKQRESVCVIGGAKTISSFLTEGLLQELWVDVEPIALNGGKNLFTETAPAKTNLRLLSAESTTSGMVQLRYEVVA